VPTIISMQDVRTALAAIAKRAATGESFVVIRNSRPAFRIEPVNQPGGLVPAAGASRSLDSITARLDAARAGSAFSADDLDRIIHAVHLTA